LGLGGESRRIGSMGVLPRRVSHKLEGGKIGAQVSGRCTGVKGKLSSGGGGGREMILEKGELPEFS